MDWEERVRSGRDWLARVPCQEVVGLIILGSGFKGASQEMQVLSRLSLGEALGLKSPQVAGHGQDLLLVEHRGRNVLVATGRYHLYEGYSPEEVVRLVRLAHALGAQWALLTNAAGSLGADLYEPGDLVAVEDQINLTGQSCLVGSAQFGPIFVDMSRPMTLSTTWVKQGRGRIKAGGVYCGLMGPAYETAAEVRMLRAMGANLVGMSTVQEVLAARQLGMDVAVLSFVTNLAGGLGGVITHDHVLDLTRKHEESLRQSILDFLDLDQARRLLG